MTLLNRSLYPCRHATILVGSLVLAFAAPVRSQQVATATSDAPAAPVSSADSFPFEIGHAVKAGAAYTVEATQPATSKLTGQKVRLKIVTTEGLSKTTHDFTLATGKHKTVAQIDTVLSEVFHHFLTNPPPAAPGQEIGKIGDARYGGEVHFVAEPSNQLRFDNLTPGQPVRASYFSRTDVEALQTVLTGVPSA